MAIFPSSVNQGSICLKDTKTQRIFKNNIMKILLPENIFTSLLEKNLPDDLKAQVKHFPSSLITRELNNNDSAAALIPITDLLNNKELFVSGKAGLSFEESLCNSYLYFNSQNKDLSRVGLAGDVSSIEALLSKILFKELYNTDVNISLITGDNKYTGENIVLVGNKNFKDEIYTAGISFAEEIIELINLPFVNFVFASKSKDLLEELNSKIPGIGRRIYDSVEENEFGNNLSDTTRDYIKTNISSAVFEFNKQDIDGIDQLLRLPYYHGIIKDIVVVNFVT